jgi:hypothetical protein
VKRSLYFPGLLILTLSACSELTLDDDPIPASLVRIENGPEAEVRAVWVNVVSVAKRRDLAAFKKLILPADLPDFETREKDRPGSYESLMEAISSENPKDYRMELTSSLATFTADPTPKMGDYRKKPPIKVMLFRDGDQWKLGKS